MFYDALVALEVLREQIRRLETEIGFLKDEVASERLGMPR
jgi:hypothetical protein